jgi:hypothetical protein
MVKCADSQIGRQIHVEADVRKGIWCRQADKWASGQSGRLEVVLFGLSEKKVLFQDCIICAFLATSGFDSDDVIAILIQSYKTLTILQI